MTDEWFVDKSYEVVHADGWGFRLVTPEGFPDCVQILAINDDGEVHEKLESFIWGDGVRKLGEALIEKANDLEEEGLSPETVNDHATKPNASPVDVLCLMIRHVPPAFTPVARYRLIQEFESGVEVTYEYRKCPDASFQLSQVTYGGEGRGDLWCRPDGTSGSGRPEASGLDAEGPQEERCCGERPDSDFAEGCGADAGCGECRG